MQNPKPRLAHIEPHQAAIYRGFIAMNFMLGLGLLAGLVRTNEFFIVGEIFTLQVWGALYLALGLWQLAAYVLNNLDAMRTTLVAGLAIQMFWGIALLARQIETLDANLFLLIFFSLTAYYKFYLYRYFPTRKEAGRWSLG